MAERSSPTPEEVLMYVEALENALVAIHGFICGAMTKEEPWEEGDVREAFLHVQSMVERVLPEVVNIRALMEEADGEPPVVH